MSNKPDLLDTLDRAAALLLEKAEIGDNLSGEKATVATTLTEQVKAFEAVVDWAKTRKDLRPPQKEESRFDGIKREFNGTAASNRGSKSKKKATNGSYAAALGSADDPDTPAVFDA
jgi:hypothetical protein